MTCEISAMPGPASRATIFTPLFVPFLRSEMVTSPHCAYSRMLRLISEIAVVMRVESQTEKPASMAMARPCWRAATTSAGELICTRTSCPIAVHSPEISDCPVHGLQSEFSPPDSSVTAIDFRCNAERANLRNGRPDLSLSMRQNSNVNYLDSVRLEIG